jgi:uncharacterized protein YndB with AHSA1/START domain
MTLTEVKTTQVYEVYIKAPAQRVWDAITSPEWTQKYAYQARQEVEPRVGGSFKAYATDDMRKFGGLPEVIIDGEVLEYDPPKRLVHTWHAMFSPEQIAEPATRITYELEETSPGFTRLTLVHDLEGAPQHAQMVASQWNEGAGGGWTWILSDLKSFLETGKTMSE